MALKVRAGGWCTCTAKREVDTVTGFSDTANQARVGCNSLCMGSVDINCGRGKKANDQRITTRRNDNIPHHSQRRAQWSLQTSGRTPSSIVAGEHGQYIEYN